MKPWELLHNFHKIREHNRFTPRDLSLYSYLVWTAWESGCWSGLQVTNDRLNLEAGFSNDQTLEKARVKLAEAGLIKYVKGKKGSPTKYTLLSPSKCGSQIEVNNKYGYKIEPQSEPYIEPQSEPQSEDIISKGKVEEKNNNSNGFISQEEAMRRNDILNQLEFDARRVGLPWKDDGDWDVAIELEGIYGLDWLFKAIPKVAGLNESKRDWRYVRGILRNWKKQGGTDEEVAAKAVVGYERKVFTS